MTNCIRQCHLLPGRLSRPRALGQWRQLRPKTVLTASAVSYVVDTPQHEALAQAFLPPPNATSIATSHPLEGVSIAYHWRRKKVLEETSGVPKNARIIGIRDPATGYLYMDEPGVEGEQLDHARQLYESTSVAERSRMVQEEMALVVARQTIMASAKDYRDDDAKIKIKLKRQLLNCMSAKDVFRVAAAAFQHHKSTNVLSRLGEHIVRAFFRSRSSASDYSIAVRMLVLVTRFDKLGVAPHPLLLAHGLKFAARSRNLKLCKRYLRELRDRKVTLTSTSFRAVIAKCSIGKQGFGEIRNGRWKRHELMQFLLGFPDDPPGHECHLKTFLVRTEWQYTAAWSQILSRMGAHAELWREWLLWKHSEARRRDRAICHATDHPHHPCTWRLRGDRWFVQVFIDAGRLDCAWQVLRETGLDPFLLRRECLHQLLERADLATVWSERMRLALVEKLQEDLAAIEQMLGVEWVKKDGIGYHAPLSDAARALEKLSEPDFFNKYGFYMNEDDKD